MTSASIDRVSGRSPTELADTLAARRTPCIVTDVVDAWPAYALWSFDYLSARIGSRMVKVGVARGPVFHYGSDRYPQTQTRELPFNVAVRRIVAGPESGPGSERLYIMEQNDAGKSSVPDVYPELADDFQTPVAIAAHNLRQINLWVGAAGNVTPLHFDAANNFLAQIRGRKRLTLYHPAQSELLYPNGSRVNPSNTSQVLVQQPDLQRHPRFKDAVAMECVLHAGEMLYLPPYWWHQVESLDAAISLNFWWKPRLEQCLQPMGTQSIFYHYDRGELQHAGDVVDLAELDNLAGAGRYCLEQGHLCVAVLFAKAEFDRRQAADSGASMHRSSDQWQDLIRKAELGDDQALDRATIAAMLERLAHGARVE
jgi:[protein]-arginine 3-hydroxylase / protease